VLSVVVVVIAGCSCCVVCQAQQQTDNQASSPVDILSSDFNANRISPTTRPSQPSVTSPAPRVIRIIRAPGTGLGISIAGGRGSVPFIGTDEVIVTNLCTSQL